MKKGFMSVMFLVVIVALVGVAGYFVFTEKVSAPILGSEQEPIYMPTPIIPTPIPTQMTLLQDCPEVWYDNRMPMVVDEGQSRPVTQYFIYKGERHELAEFDMNWVNENCNIAPSVVY